MPSHSNVGTPLHMQVAKAEGAEDGTQADVQIECPLCHTKFSLENGKVAEYCPKDGPLAWAIGTLKSKESPVDAKVRTITVSILTWNFLFLFSTMLALEGH